MGGGDLNTKKSWHPTNRSNQEKVWKAEQKEAQEKKRLEQLQREIQEEKDREELKNIARTSGYLDDQDPNKKLEWMYKGQQLNREEYLLGRRIDKTFEQQQEEDHSKAQSVSNPAITVPKNHVEHEVVPFSIRQYKGLPAGEQVDMARKLMEDPLMVIKQKEMETRRKILENPVRLKEIHRMLKQEKGEKGKKEKKSKKKKKRSRSSSNSDSDVDLDRILAEKYQKLQGALQKGEDSEEEDNVDKLLSMKYEALTKELDKMTNSKKKKKKKRNSSSSSDDFRVSSKNRRSKSPEKRRNRSKSMSHSPSYRQPRRRSPTPEKKFYSSERGSHFNRYRTDNRGPYDRNQTRRSRSPYNRNRQYEQRRSRSGSRNRPHRRTPDRRDIKERRQPEKVRKGPSTPPQPRKRQSPSPKKSKPYRSSSSSSDDSPKRNYDSDTERPIKKAFGLVGADGKQIAIKSTVAKRRSKSPEPQKKSSSNKVTDYRKPKSSKLSQEELDQRLHEMMSNASWREKERSEKVRKHREEERREAEEAKHFDKDFLTKQLKKTSSTTVSVEARIKSNLNNIQRSSRMDSNFVRR